MIKNADNKLKLLLFVVAFLLFANTLGHDYTWDDSIVITENPRVKKGFAGIPDLFLKYNSEYKSDKYGYRPIVLTSFAMEYALFKLNPKAGHFMNVLYFALLCVVIFTVLRKIFYRFTNLGPFLIAVLFLVHPVHVEVVANIKSRDEIFALLFSLLSLNQFIVYYQTMKIRPLVFCILLFLGAFLSKESAITFLAIMPLSMVLIEGRLNLKKILRPSIYVVVLLVVSFIIVKLYTGTSRGSELSKGAGIFYENGLLGNSFFYTWVWTGKLANALSVLLLYLKNFFWPVTLVYFSGYNQVPVASWSQPLVIVSLLVHLGLLFFSIIKWKKNEEISYGILFYFISISIYTHLFRVLADTMADRFLFAPSLGLAIITVFAILRILKVDYRSLKVEHVLVVGMSIGKAGTRLKYIFLVIFLLLGFRTFNRNKVWKNNFALFAHDMPYLENCARAHNYYADELKTKLQAAFDANIEAEMIMHYKKSFGISREAYYAYLGLGTYYCSAKNYREGISLLDTMVTLFPGQADPHFYLGQALLQTGDFERAVFHLEKSLLLAPEVLSTYYTLSIAVAKKGEYEKAITIITKAKEKFHESATIYDALGNIYYEKGDLEQSTKQTLEMLRFGQDPQNVYGTIIGRYQTKKQDSLATFYYRQALSMGVFKRTESP